ncbi:glutathione S-transferase family protein [Marinobacter salinisoli]|uniref:Glutathione S-transferase family protein n=1 Tax=Marinobacter salinisoli TaxID=2769486 RepID=A0ABX7N1W1_9GAMM|nr:glutathione S-transferase family protein [Marinobacter salinisoli]QSP96363.1 glutathione S-transferase family protein [Marinobacter salinisoli]
MYTLHIGNKNYSSWSLRPWLLVKALGIPFEEVLHRFGMEEDWAEYRKLNASGLVPCLFDGDLVVWDSLAIIEYLAEKHEGVWPADSQARAWARSASAEMHSGFAELRSKCTMTCGQRVELHEVTPALSRDIARIDALWQEGLSRFGGPFLAGPEFSAVDAFYAPVVFRFQTFGISVSPQATAYVERMLAHPAMVAWYEDALQETFRDEPHEAELNALGRITADFRQ